MDYVKLRDDMLAIWQAGVDGVRPDKLIRDCVTLLPPTDYRNSDNRDYSIEIGKQYFSEQYHLSEIDRIIIVGGGKASGGMAESLTKILEPISNRVEIFGWVNVPNDCVKPLDKVYLHAARPVGINEPTEEAVAGTNEIIRILKSATKFDLCFCLISGGGSALLPSPVAEISLADKRELTRFLSGEGATIQELNSVRKIISQIKGGGLKQICRGKRLISLILSDVLGDPLDVIASGLTVDNNATAKDALLTLQKFTHNKPDFLLQNLSLKKIFNYVESQAKKESTLNSNFSKTNSSTENSSTENSSAENFSTENFSTVKFSTAQFSTAKVTNAKTNSDVEFGDLQDKIIDREGGFVCNIVIGNNALAVEAAGMEAIKRGYKATMFSAGNSEGEAENVGRELIQLGLDMLDTGSDCLIHGGEPVVKLSPPEIRGVGGRNQQLVLAAVCELIKYHKNEQIPLGILSGSTDGEDGPTDAAGAWIDPIAWKILNEKIKQDPNFKPESFLKRNDAYNFFKELNALIKTGITGTNVCDIRIVIKI